MKTEVKILTGSPVVAPIAEQGLIENGIKKLIGWVESHRPECLPARDPPGCTFADLFPHKPAEQEEGRLLTGNELLVELAGRKCYDSFGYKAGRKTNAEYIAHTQACDVPHSGILYHAKMTFFLAGISRRLTHELIRHYVGADRDEEGSPSMESTRYTHHYGWYVAHPYVLMREDDAVLRAFKTSMQHNYDDYQDYVNGRIGEYKRLHEDAEPQGLERKRIYESASAYLSHAAETSLIWTTNPVALAKLIRERDNRTADLEMQRLARVWKNVCLERWPNLFPQPWMQRELAQ